MTIVAGGEHLRADGGGQDYGAAVVVTATREGGADVRAEAGIASSLSVTSIAGNHVVVGGACVITSNCEMNGHFQYKIIIFQGQFSIISSFSIETNTGRKK